MHYETGPNRRNVTCVNLDRIVDASESENVLEVGTRDREFLGLASRSKDQLIIMNKLFASFQHNPLSRNVDGSDSLEIYVLLRHHITGEFRDSTYSRGA